MNKLFDKEISRPGNDCWIEEGFYIFEVFDRYLAFHITHYSGWMGDEFVKESEIFSSKQLARNKLNEWGLADL